MNSSPSADRSYLKDFAEKQKEVEERITQESKKVLLAALDEENRARIINRWCAVGAIAVILAIMFFSVKFVHAETIDMEAIAMIESSNNPQAFNPQDGAIGKYQITGVVLREYNSAHKQKFLISNLYNEQVNFEVASWYMRVRIPQMLVYYHLPLTTTNKIISWNAGISNARKGRIPFITKQYLKKYARLTGRRP